MEHYVGLDVSLKLTAISRAARRRRRFSFYDGGWRCPELAHREVLIVERVRHVNRVKGLLFSQGISGYEPLRRPNQDHFALAKCLQTTCTLTAAHRSTPRGPAKNNKKKVWEWRIMCWSTADVLRASFGNATPTSAEKFTAPPRSGRYHHLRAVAIPCWRSYPVDDPTLHAASAGAAARDQTK